MLVYLTRLATHFYKRFDRRRTYEYRLHTDRWQFYFVLLCLFGFWFLDFLRFILLGYFCGVRVGLGLFVLVFIIIIYIFFIS